MSNIPVMAIPKYKLELPVSKKVIEYRPFLVKEEKILMLAEPSDNDSEREMALRQIIENCSFGQVSVDDLCLADFEWLLLHLRGKSRGYGFEIAFRCLNEVDGKVCGTTNEIKGDLNNAVVVGGNETDKIMLTDEIGVKMRVPTLKQLGEINTIPELDLVYKSIDTIFNMEDMWVVGSDIDYDAVVEFVDNLTAEQLEKLIEWVSNSPHVEVPVKYKCVSCGVEDTIVLKGLNDFFG